MTNRQTLLFMAAGAIGVVMFFPGRNIPHSIQMQLVDALRNTSAIVLGFSGMWMAILFPSLIKERPKSSVSRSDEYARAYEPMFISAVVVGGTILVGPIAEIARTFQPPAGVIEELRGLMFAGLFLATLAEGWALFVALAPGEYNRQQLEVQDKVEDHKRRNQTNNKLVSISGR